MTANNKKMPSCDKGLLVRMRSLNGYSINELRREFKTPELTAIEKAPWASYALDHDDLNIISQVQANISKTIVVRKKINLEKKKEQQEIRTKRSLKKTVLVN